MPRTLNADDGRIAQLARLIAMSAVISNPPKNISMSVAAGAAVFQDRVRSLLPEYENDSKVPGTKLCSDRF